MDKKLETLEPRVLWEQFFGLCTVPRPSKHEEQVVEYIKAFAAKHQIECYVDEVGNVILRKEATKGYENRPGVILQGHLDMVPQKDSDVEHDFLKDSIKPRIDGDWVKATGTTLGADNGIGVAAGLAALIDPTVEHGPLEVLLTIDEETGMTGANYLKPGLLKGSIFINLDSETLGELCIGCAGGINGNITMKYETEAIPADYNLYKLTLSGLHGGHSGIDINLGRGNANKLLNRFLWSERENLRLAEFDGGNMRNAIPREASAVVAIHKDKFAAVEASAHVYLQTISNELKGVEADLSFELTPAQGDKVLTLADGLRLMRLVYGMPNGVIRMVPNSNGLVETSTNLAIVRTKDGVAELICLLRSSVDTAKMDLSEAVAAVSESCGAVATFDGAYPGWQPNFDSPVLKTMQKVYADLFKEEAHIKAVHAGLECGIFGKAYPDMQYISCGPTIQYPHSPSEQVNIPSVAKFWEYLQAVLKAL